MISLRRQGVTRLPRPRRLGFLLAFSSCLAAATCTGPAHGSGRTELRPYDPRSAWNLPIGRDARIRPGPVPALARSSTPLSADPDQYTPAVYTFDAATPIRNVRLAGFFSTYDDGDGSRVGHGFAPTISGVPIPSRAVASAGNDAHIIIWDPASGVEYGFWDFDRDRFGGYVATNGYRYHTTAGYFGRFADGKAGRGAGTPYLAGLVRAWEIDQGRIDHALAFTYNEPSSRFVYPASRSDGTGGTADLPAGSRLVLDPTRTEADFDDWGLTSTAKIIARALQTYGMYVVGKSRSATIYLEDRRTAGWGSTITRNLTRSIPMAAFRLVTGTTPSPETRVGAAEPMTSPAGPARRNRAATGRRQAQSIMDQIVRILRKARSPTLRSRRGIKLVVATRSTKPIRVMISSRRTRLASGTSRSVRHDARVAIRLRPTRSGKRMLRPRRHVVVHLRVGALGARSMTAMKRSLRLRG